MDFALSEDQEMLRKTARKFLEKHWPREKLREVEEEERGYSPELWRKMAELGWMGLIFPEEYGGSGGSFLDLMVLLEEFGRKLVSSPFLSTVVCCGLPILAVGSRRQKQDFLSKIAKGELVATLALTEPTGSYCPSGIEVRAFPKGNDYVISGTKLFVSDAHVADCLLCVTRTRDGQRKEEGITLFLVDTKSPGVNCTLLKTLASDRQCEVVFDSVKVPKENMLGEHNQGWEIIEQVMEHGAIAYCAMMVGGAQKVLEMSVDYAKQRIQFGRPIGSFQAIQHKCANMLVDIDASRFITYEAGWKLSQGLPATKEVAMAKCWTGEAYRRVCAEGHQIHGGVGFITDHDMQRYFRQAKMMDIAFGDSNFYREVVSQRLATRGS